MRSVTFRDHFSGVAEQYAASRPGYPSALIERLASLATSGAAGARRAWDAGCGSGQLSTLLADAFDEVLAADASPQQIAAARPHARVSYRVAAAEASGLEAGTIDLCVAAQAVHWFDLNRYYAEVRRVARPGGAIALLTYHRPRAGRDVEPALDALIRAVAPYWPPERRPVEELYANLPFPFAEEPVPEMWMEQSWPLERLLGYLRTGSSTQAFVRAVGPRRLEELMLALRAAWGDPERARTVRWPLTIRAGRVA